MNSLSSTPYTSFNNGMASDDEVGSINRNDSIRKTSKPLVGLGESEEEQMNDVAAGDYLFGKEGGAGVALDPHGEAPLKPAPLWKKILLMVILVSSGAGMTLCMKTQDLTCLDYCNLTNLTGGNYGEYDIPPEELIHYFHQPFFQLFHLGFGQLLSGAFTPFFNDEASEHLRPISFRQFMPQAALASLFDICAEVLIILGLSLTFASVTEMLKTTMVVFVGILSIYFFPGFKINWKQWVASFFMLVGAVLVILQTYVGDTGSNNPNALKETFGALLVIGAQVFYGLEFVVEEKLIDGSKAKGLHVNKAKLVMALGVLSMTGAVILQLPWQAIMSDFSELPHDIKVYFEITSLWLPGIGISFAVMGFDLAGLAISEIMGSDRRAISVAAFQVAVVWSISLGVKWESFSYLALGGFLLILTSGTIYVAASKEKAGPHFNPRKKSRLGSLA